MVATLFSTRLDHKRTRDKEKLLDKVNHFLNVDGAMRCIYVNCIYSHKYNTNSAEDSSEVN